MPLAARSIICLPTHPPRERTRPLFRPPQQLSTPPREINPAISPRVEDAILWAMELHPNERPRNVKTFLKALTGESTSSLRHLAGKVNFREYQGLDRTEMILLYIAGGLTFFLACC